MVNNTSLPAAGIFGAIFAKWYNMDLINHILIWVFFIALCVDMFYRWRRCKSLRRKIARRRMTRNDGKPTGTVA
jgi:uncharacterized membrane protein